MAKIIYCSDCSVKVAVIMEGSLLKAGSVMLCSVCEVNRKKCDSKYSSNPFPELFKDIFGNKS